MNALAGNLHLLAELPVAQPFDWEGTLAFLAARAIPGCEEVDDQEYRRLVRTGDGPRWIGVRYLSERLRLEVLSAVEGEADAAGARVAALFDTEAQPAEIAAALSTDPSLEAGVAAIPGIRVPGCWDPFELGVRAIVGQQVSVAGASTLAGRIAERFGEPVDSASEDGLRWLFPAAQTLASADLGGIGMPARRAKTISAFAEAVAEGRVDFGTAAESERLQQQLLAIPGIGPWTASYIAMRGVGDKDAFLANDLIVRRRLGSSGNPASPRAALARAEAWRPYRAYAVMYLWAANHTASVAVATARSQENS